jgi:hypothetical protein
LSKRITIQLLIFLSLALTACSYDYHVKDEGYVRTQRVLFKNLCDAKHRSVIYRSASVDGYLVASDSGRTCGSAWSDFIGQEYSHKECAESKVIGDTISGKEELYRFTLEEVGHPDCALGEEFINKSGRYSNQYKKYHNLKAGDLSGLCLAAKRINKPLSRYMKVFQGGHIDEYGKHYLVNYSNAQVKKKGLLTFDGYKIIDIGTGEIIAENWNYKFFPKSLIYITANTEKCRDPYLLLNTKDVLQPRK